MAHAASSNAGRQRALRCLALERLCNTAVFVPRRKVLYRLRKAAPDELGVGAVIACW
jgi:hypothetical protein